MSAVPAVTPDIVPEVPIVATVDEGEDQLPPVVISDKVIDRPVHTVVGPVMADTVGIELTAIVFVVIHAPGSV